MKSNGSPIKKNPSEIAIRRDTLAVFCLRFCFCFNVKSLRTFTACQCPLTYDKKRNWWEPPTTSKLRTKELFDQQSGVLPLAMEVFFSMQTVHGPVSMPACACSKLSQHHGWSTTAEGQVANMTMV